MPSHTLPTEEQEQRTLVEWLDWHRICYAHPANESKRSAIQGARLKAIGMSPGLPDLLLFDPPPLYTHMYRGAAIELKRRKGGRVSETQRDWLERLRLRGWAVAVCEGADAAIAQLESWGYGKRKGVLP
ncbi:MAG: VRR-NUC domain-containing protein [Patescibacteria group bacterium]|nr:VRR-NUC domain-containing protein [Patescibacteria group bacterium]